MALTKCPECNREVSDQAAACPHCGNPFTCRSPSGERTQLIEQTHRGWKAMRVLGWLLIVAGVLALRANVPTYDAAGPPVRWWVAGAGLACLIASKVGAWWYHG